MRNRRTGFFFHWKHIIKAALLSCLMVISTFCKKEDSLREVPQNIRLRTGDLLLRRGRSAESRVIVTADNSTMYSHIGMLIWYDHQWCVIRTSPGENENNEPDRQKIERYDLFFRTDRASRGQVLRMPIAEEDTLKLYNYSLFVNSYNPLFDNAFDACDTTQYYCSELICHIYQSAPGIDPTQGIRHKFPFFHPLIYISDISHYPRIEEIYKFD